MNQSIIDKLNQFFGKYEPKTYAKGEDIILANQDPDGVSLIVEGVVEQYDITPEGNKLTVNIFRQGSFFPMSWAINKTPNPYFFGALTDVTLRQADADETVDFLRANPDAMFDLLSRVYKGTDAVLRRLVLAASGIAANRLIYEVLLEAYRFGSETEDNKTIVKVKQSALASRSGLARETVSREFHKLEQQNLVTKTKQGLVLDIKTLERKLDLEI